MLTWHCGGEHRRLMTAGTLLTNLSDYELWIGDLDADRRDLAESIDIVRALDARHSAAIATFNLGLTEYLDGSAAAAAALFTESLDLARRMGMKRHAAYALLGLALAGRGEADPSWAVRMHGAADQSSRWAPSPSTPCDWWSASTRSAGIWPTSSGAGAEKLLFSYRDRRDHAGSGIIRM